MHVHLPKPLHGWREFLHEVAIIVLGVLVALGLEQVVTSSHDRASAAETRASIRSEIVQRRLGEIAAFLDATAEGHHSLRPTWIGAPYAPLAGDTAFKSAQSAGKFFLLPESEQERIDVFYVDGADFNEQNTREWYDWAQLRSLTSPGTQLTESEITRLRQALQDARGADWLIREDITEFIKRAKQEGITTRDHPIPAEQLAPACLPFDMPYAQASAKANRKELGVPE
jgi:hypothetical protein